MEAVGYKMAIFRRRLPDVDESFLEIKQIVFPALVRQIDFIPVKDRLDIFPDEGSPLFCKLISEKLIDAKAMP